MESVSADKEFVRFAVVETLGGFSVVARRGGQSRKLVVFPTHNQAEEVMIRLDILSDHVDSTRVDEEGLQQAWNNLWDEILA